MSIRVQPAEIDVPPDDPFQYDLLERKEPVEVLTSLVGSIEGPCVLAVDAAWGAGKTTFLRIWKHCLRNQKFPVVEFNAWESDFSGDPLVALSTELTEGLDEYKKGTLTDKIDTTRKLANEVLRQSIPGLVRFAAAGIPYASLLGEAAAQALTAHGENEVTGYQKAKESVEQYRAALKDMAETLSQASENRPLIVMIDELDRCRPSYAVELLEIAKHLFAVDRIVFVLAVNRSQLAHSIKAVYGSEFDADGYLRRFFDVDFHLPDPERDKFIDALLNGIEIDHYFKRTSDPRAKVNREAAHVRDLLKGFFGAHDLSLRQIAQAIHRLGLVYASLPSNHRSFAVMATVLLIVRTIDQNLYHKFKNMQISDLEVVNNVFDHPGMKTLRHTAEGCFFEAMIVLAHEEERFARPRTALVSKSLLLEQYEKRVSAEKLADGSRDPEYLHARTVSAKVKNLTEFAEMQWLGFKPSVQRLELLSSDLVEEHAGVSS